MEKAIAVIQTALPVFLALGLGMLCRSRGFLSREGVDALKKVVINLTLPFVLLGAFATAEYSVSALILPALMFGICCLALGLGFLAVRIFRIKGRLTAFLASGFEAGMLGYALFALLFFGVLDVPLRFLTNACLDLLVTLTSWIPMLFGF